MSLRRYYRFLPALLCMAAIFWFSSQPGSEVGRAVQPLYKNAPTVRVSVEIPWLKVGHMVGYGVLGAALLYAFGSRKRRMLVLTLAVTLFYAVTDEIHQIFTPGRHAGFYDVAIDLWAAVIAVLLYKTGKYLRHINESC